MTSNSFDTLAELDTGTGKARFHSLSRLERAGFAQVGKLPRTIKILLEAALRGEDGLAVREEDVGKLAQYNPVRPAKVEIPAARIPARTIEKAKLMEFMTHLPPGDLKCCHDGNHLPLCPSASRASWVPMAAVTGRANSHHLL